MTLEKSDLEEGDVVDIRRNDGSWITGTVKSLSIFGAMTGYVGEDGRHRQKQVSWPERFCGIRKAGDNEDVESNSRYSQVPTEIMDRPVPSGKAASAFPSKATTH